MKKLFVAALIVMGMVFWGCEKDNPGGMYPDFNEDPVLKSSYANEIESQSGSITGRVFFAGCTVPISGAEITICEETVNSCEDGIFCLENVPLGTHELVASKDEYEPFSEEVKIMDKDCEIVVYMTSKQHSAKVTGKLRGDFTGNPMKGLKVVILNPDESESKLTSVSGFDGVFHLPSVPHGERKIIVKSNNDLIYQGEFNVQDPEFKFDMEVEEAFEFRDNRDGRKYKAIRIGNQTWMEENLAYREYPQVTGEVYIEEPVDDEIGLDGLEFAVAGPKRDPRKYGQLYTWDEARKACPEGWHLPTDLEWKVLEKNLGMSSLEADSRGRRESDAEAIKVKSTQDWMDGGNGSNQSGFNVLPAGMSRYGKEIRLGSHAYFWTATQQNSTKAWFRDVYFAKSGINRLYYNKNAGYSVRCVKNVERINTPTGSGIK